MDHCDQVEIKEAAGGDGKSATWIILVRFSLDNCKEPDEFPVLIEDISLRIRKECPQIHQLNCYATLGKFDMVLTIRCEDVAQVQRAALIFRSNGQASALVMCALPWKEFLEKL